MSTNFPSSLDNLDLTRGSAGQPLSSPNHVTHHTNEDDAIEALEAKVGIDGSADTTSLDYKVKSTSSVDPGHKHSTSAISATGTPSAVTFLRGDNTWNPPSPVKFGGNGSDGALAITSGVTTIDLGSAQVVVKNYTSISITGTASLAFSNPHANGTTLIILSQGDITITSSANPAIDFSGTGAAKATDGYGFLRAKTNKGTTSPGALPTDEYANALESALSFFAPHSAPGAGGGDGSHSGGGAGTPGVGGRGGGVLIMSCLGSWNITSNISVAGKDGTSGSGSGEHVDGGGGGGAGGIFIGLCGTVVADSGTKVVTGGSGGNGSASGNVGATNNGGGGGGSTKAAGSAHSGSTGADSGFNGGAGAPGFSKVNI